MNAWLEQLRQPPGAVRKPSDGDRVPDHYFAQGSLPLASLALEVEGFGVVSQPLLPSEAATLHGLSEPAHFGVRERTLLDTGVRHTGEVDADLIGLQWQPGVFASLQRDVARSLGVEWLEARLHTLLIYGPGQFFKPHQDTERHPGMVATLVLVWPSAHIGGELCVRLGQNEGRLASQHLHAQALRWFVFFADCRHEVLPVEEGWRVVLTFDLVAPRQSQRVSWPPELQATVQTGLRQRFEPDTSGAQLRPWVLLLDHEYTEHGLRWSLLKGDDRWRVALLRSAAESLGLRVHLALVELHESWSTQPVFRTRTGRSGRGYDEMTDEVVPEELLDDAVSLDFWVDAQDQIGPRRALVIRREDMVCFVETGAAHLVEEAYEGYMGNYGNTVDYWYRRAALVIRTPLADERDRFELDVDAALDAARQLARDPAQAAVLAERVQAASATLKACAAARGRELLDAYAEIAAALPEPEAATALMSPFDPTRLEAQDAAVLARLERQRDSAWLRALLKVWYAPNARHWGALGSWQAGWKITLDVPCLWPRPLPAFVAAAVQAGWSNEALDGLLDACLSLLARFDQASRQATPVNRISLQPGLLDVIGELAQALVLRAKAGERQLQILIDQILASPQLYPLPSLPPVVEAVGVLGVRWPATAALRSQVIGALQARLAEPERTADDHSLRGITWVCRCADCAQLIDWAESPAAAPLVMAMAESRRRHVEQTFTDAGAPLAATTLRQGSPHKLVLAKPADLQARDRLQRDGWAQGLSMLAGG